MRDLPKLGAREDQRTEFKSAEMLRTDAGRRRLLREVVGMLNAGGGSVWVGVRESGEEAVGYEPIEPKEASRGIAALKDALLDAIQPRVELDRDLAIREHEVAGGVIVQIEMRARGAGDLPFHIVGGDHRTFLKRHDDRLRPMTLDEIRSPASISVADPDPDTLVERSLADLRAAVEEREDPWFFFAGRIVGPTRDPLTWTAQVDRLLVQPPEEIVRRDGWGFQVTHSRWPKFRGAKGGNNYVLTSGHEENGYRLLEARRDGTMAFRTRLDHLQHMVPAEAARLHSSARGALYPYALVETVVSLVRLLRHLWSDANGSARAVVAKVELSGVRDWLLPPYAPRATGYHFIDSWCRSEKSSIATNAHTRPAEHFWDNPDPLAFLLVRDVYAEFGFPDDSVIPCFPGDHSRFVMPR